MIRVDEKELIRKLHVVQGKGIREIVLARGLFCSRARELCCSDFLE